MDDLIALEQALWSAETRFDRKAMNALFSDDVEEFGRSGKRHTRKDLLCLKASSQDLAAKLHMIKARHVSQDIALVTYVSEVGDQPDPEWSNRASIWDRSSGTWQLRFHQGTPTDPLR